MEITNQFIRKLVKLNLGREPLFTSNIEKYLQFSCDKMKTKESDIISVG